MLLVPQTNSLTFYFKCSNLIQTDRDKSDKPKYRPLNSIKPLMIGNISGKNLIQTGKDKSDKPKFRPLNFILHQTSDDWNYYSEKFIYFIPFSTTL